MWPLLVLHPAPAARLAAPLHSHSASPTPRAGPGAWAPRPGACPHSMSSPTAAELRAWPCWAPHSDPASPPPARQRAAGPRPRGQPPCSSREAARRGVGAAPRRPLQPARRLQPRSLTPWRPPALPRPRYRPPAHQGRTMGDGGRPAAESARTETCAPPGPRLLTRLPRIPPAPARAHLASGEARLPGGGRGERRCQLGLASGRGPRRHSNRRRAAVRAPEPRQGPGAARRQAVRPRGRGGGRD